jgi:hypothetical protein
MKTLQNKRILGAAGALLVALSGAFSRAEAGIQDRIDTAWRQAATLAGIDAGTLVRPEIVFEAEGTGPEGHMAAEYVPFANEVHVYRTASVPFQYLLVHEFLHAICHQTRGASLSLAELAQSDPSESWVRERMAQNRAL